MGVARLVLLSAVLALPGFAQLDSETLTVTASRTINVQPDQVLFSVTVSSAGGTLDQVVSALSATGITASNFSSLNVGTNPSALQWTFALAVPLTKMADTIAQLTALSRNIAMNQSGLALIFTVTGTQASAQALQAQACPIASLVSDARTQAQKLADAAQVNLGPILEISNTGANTAGTASGVIVAGLLPVTAFFVPPAPSTSCVATVKFRIVGG